MQLVFNTKANLSQPLSLQFVCNQTNWRDSGCERFNQLVFAVYLVVPACDINQDMERGENEC